MLCKPLNSFDKRLQKVSRKPIHLGNPGGVVRWRLVDLIAWVWEEFRITISKQTLSRELRAMNYRKLSARPRHHARSEAEVSAFKKGSPPIWRRSRRMGLAAGQ